MVFADRAIAGGKARKVTANVSMKRREDNISVYHISFVSEVCSVKRPLSARDSIAGARNGIDIFLEELEGMRARWEKLKKPATPPFEPSLFYSDGILSNVIVRLRRKSVEGQQRDCIVLSAVYVRSESRKGNGAFSGILDHMERIARERGWLAVCESVRPSLCSHLARRGYVPLINGSTGSVATEFGNDWIQAAGIGPAIISLPADVLAMMNVDFVGDAATRMQTILTEEAQALAARIKGRFKTEVGPLHEQDIKAVRAITAARGRSTAA